MAYLHSGGRHTSKVLAKHRVRMSITCEDPFEMSVLHLISYHKLHYLHYLPQFLLGDENCFKFRALEDSMFDYFLEKYEEIQVNGHKKTVRTGDGPLALAIKSHTQGTEVINECFDAEGYNALHRAAQGANVVAIKKFLAWGADPFLENSYGYSPLWLAVLNSVKYTPFLNFHKKNVLTALEVDLASMSASVILSHLLLRGSVDIACDKRRPDLTLYHIAAIRGMWQFISRLFSDKRITGLDVNCANKHGITPMYLAKLVGGATCEWDSPWCKVLKIIQSRGGTLQYPTQEAEYFLISTLFFGMRPGYTFLELTEHEILTLQDDCGRDECKRYKNGETDLLKSSCELDRLYNEYDKKLAQCFTCSKRCLPEIKRDLPYFKSVKAVFRDQQPLKLHHGSVRDNFVKFLDEESKHIQSILREVTKPYIRVSCSKGRQPEGMTIGGGSSEQNDTCTDGMSLESALRLFYRNFKSSSDQLQRLTEKARSYIFSKGIPPRLLSEIGHALHNYDTTLSCDWQAISTRYVMLSFQIRNFKLATQHVKENSRVVSISDFASHRIQEVFVKPSQETLRLVLRLASERSSGFDDLDYLMILRFRKPPLWKGTF